MKYHFGVTRFRRLLLVSCMTLAATNLMDLTDTMVAGHVLGVEALAAMGLFWPCIELFFFVATCIASGSAILYSRAMGRFEQGTASKVYSNGLILSAIAGMICAGGMLLVRNLAFAYFGVSGTVLSMLRDYWNWFAIEALIFPSVVYVKTMVYSDGDTAVCTVSFVIELVVNAIASLFLCLRFGTAGCAMGTICSSSVGCLVVLSHYFKRENSLVFKRYFSWRLSWQALRADFPEACSSLCFCAMYLIVCRVIIATCGENALAVMAAVTTANGFALALYGIPTAVQPIISVYFAELNYPAVRRVMRDAVMVSIVMGMAISTFFVLLPELPVRMIGIDDPVIFSQSVKSVRIVAGFYVFAALGALATAYLLYINRIRLSIALSVMLYAVLPSVGFLVGMHFGGIVFGWLGYALSSPISLVMFFLFLKFVMREGDVPFLLPTSRDAGIFTWDVPSIDGRQACVVAQSVMKVLKSVDASTKYLVRAPMMVEDSLMEIVDRNHGSSVDAEVSLDLNDGVRLTFRDGGKVQTDGAQPDSEVDGFRSMVLTKLDGGSNRRHLVTTGFNRRTVDL